MGLAKIVTWLDSSGKGRLEILTIGVIYFARTFEEFKMQFYILGLLSPDLLAGRMFSGDLSLAQPLEHFQGKVV